MSIYGFFSAKNTTKTLNPHYLSMLNKDKMN